MHAAHHSLFVYVESWRGSEWASVSRERDPFVFCKNKRAIRRGREPANV